MFKAKPKMLITRSLIILLLIFTSRVNLAFQRPSIAYALASAPGSLDDSFGGDGLVTTSINGSNTYGSALSVQSDGKIIVSGQKGNINGFGDFALVRYNEDGSLDITFDSDGIVTTDFGSSNDDKAMDVVIQNDGKIVAAGYSHDVNTANTFFALARYNPSGSLDASFGNNGKVVTDIQSGNDIATSAVLQPDGRIVVVGITSAQSFAGFEKLAVVRYMPDGSLDTSFGVNGIIVADVSGDDFHDYELGANVFVQPDGKILVAVRSLSQSELVRFNSNGSLDTSFDTDGIVIIDAHANNSSTLPTVLLSNGKILVAYNYNSITLARYNSNGTLDLSFGSGGRIVTDFHYTVSGVAAQSNGKYVISGVVGDGGENNDIDFVVNRYNEDGSLDKNFGIGGIAITDFGQKLDDHSTDIDVQANGKLVVSGFSYGHLGAPDTIDVARYIGDHVIYVHENASGANNGTSWADAYTDLQSALAAASNGDEIWVASGLYKPTTGMDRTISFSLKKGVKVYGGFAGTESQVSQRNPAAYPTLLSGEIGGAGISDNSYHVVVGVGTDNTAVLDGFMVQAGNANGLSATTYENGGGMYNDNSSASLANLVFYGNFAKLGGGMGNFNSNPSLMNISFQNNTAEYYGGGLYNNNSSPSVLNATFSNNSAVYGRGGIGNYENSNPSLTNVTLHGNSALYGAGMDNYFSSPSMTNVTAKGNSAGNAGGGIKNYMNSSPIRNSIFYGNSGGEIINESSTPVVTYSIVQGGYPGLGNLNKDPLLGPLQDNSGFTETMALLQNSPALNAANDADCPATDQRGVTRPQGSHCDIGAYEKQAGSLPPKPTFADVPTSHPYFNDIEILYANGLTAGCGTSPLRFCPDQTMNRGEAAVFMLRGNLGSSFIPDPATHIFKDDWTKGTWAEPWSEGMYKKGMSAGCSSSPLKYCPWEQIPRDQAVIFALRLKYGMNYIPPAATGTLFADMTNPSYFATSWAEQAYKDGLIAACGTSGGKPLFCPKNLVSRGLAAQMIVRAKNLTMP